MLPLRLLLASALAAAGLLLWQGYSAAEVWRLLAGLSMATEDGATLGAAMAGRAGSSLLIVAVAVVLAVCCGLAVAVVSLRIGLGLPRLAGLAARAVAAFPLAALGWAAVGFIAGGHGWPIESLLPHHPAPGRDTAMLALGRSVWWWALPVLLLMLPLAGEFCSEALDRIAAARSLPLMLGLRGRGVPPAGIHYRHVMPAAWPCLLERIEWLGILGIGYAVFVEEALGVPGWGGFFAEAVKAGQVRGIAGGVYAAGWLAAVWSLLVAAVRRLTTTAPGTAMRLRCDRQKPSPMVAAVTTGTVAVAAAVTVGFGGMERIGSIVAFAARYLPLLGHDLGVLLLAGLLALVLAVSRSGLAAVLSSTSRMPRLGVLESLCWSPLLVWAAAMAAPMPRAAPLWMLLGLFAGFAVAIEFRDTGRRLLARQSIEGSLAAGVSRPRAWVQHVLPDLLRSLLGWFFAALASLTVMLALAESLPPAGGEAASLGQAIAAAKESVLTDHTAILIPAAIAAICALCFRQLSRIIQPGPPPAAPHE